MIRSKHLQTCNYKESDVTKCPYCIKNIKFNDLGLIKNYRKCKRILQKDQRLIFH